MKKSIILFLSFFIYSIYSKEVVNVNLVGYPKLFSFSMIFGKNSEVKIDGKNHSTNILHFFPQKKTVVTYDGNDIFFNEIIIKSDDITKIECKYGTQEYKGDFKLINNNEIVLINQVNIDDYFASVLGAEMGDSFSTEALKAQAIAIRTYYYCRKEKYKDKVYDINNTDGIDMVYRGSEFATKKMYDAFNKTINLFLVDENDNFALPLFHSTSGGIILKERALTNNFDDDVSNIILLYDKDKTNKPYSINSPFLNFSINISEENLIFILKDEIFLNKIVDIKLKYFPGTTCVDFIGIVDQNNITHWIKCYKFVSMAQKKGFNNLRSIQFQINREGKNFNFTGQGFGHLCGMSQYSAEYLAKNGASYIDILKKYYPQYRLKEFDLIQDKVN